MSFSTRATSQRTRLRLAAVAVAVAGMVLGTMVTASAWTPPDLPPAPSTAGATDVPTHVRIASFNLLGWNHTPKKGPRNGVLRTKYAAQIIKSNKLEIVGLQELQVPQWEEWLRLNDAGELGARYALWPGNELRATPMQNSIAYDTSRWEIVIKKTLPIPYFGYIVDMPYALFRNKQTGRLIWVLNTHNPAFKKWTKNRLKSFQMEIDLVKSLERQFPGVPVFSLGDKNEKEKYFCPIVLNTDMRSASGGGKSGGKCVPPDGWQIDWVMGNRYVNFSGYQRLRSALVKKATDHPVVFADALIQSSAVSTSRIRSVMTINVQGLRGSALNESSGVPIPHIRRLASSGASTDNARILSDGAAPLANAYGIISGRPAKGRNGGTNASTSLDHGGTVHQSAGAYVSSAFSTIHDTGRRTALWSSDKRWHERAKASWNKYHGVADRVGVDNGRDKISRDAAVKKDRTVISRTIDDLHKHRTAYTSVTLSSADRAARRHGSHSAQYARAIRAIDGQIWRLVKAINGDPGLGRRTVLIITSDHGAVRPKFMKARYLSASRVPFVVWGATVRPGSDLYTLNPQRKDPDTGRPGYPTARQPIRNADAANLATKLLGLPPVPNGRIGNDQTLTVF